MADTNDFEASTTAPLRAPTKSTRLRRLRDAVLRLLATIIASPKGDQGGWDGGARGL